MPQKSKTKPVVIIPTYDNGKTVCQVIREVGRYVPDVIVVDDGSRDGTDVLLRRLTDWTGGQRTSGESLGDVSRGSFRGVSGESFGDVSRGSSRGVSGEISEEASGGVPGEIFGEASGGVPGETPTGIMVVTHGKNRGKGQALKTGFAKARELGFTHAITIDADGQHYPSDLPVFLRAIDEHPQAIIVGSRNLNADGMPSRNSFANKFSNFWFRLYTGVSLPDTQTGYRAYPLDRLHGLRLLTSRYEAELELLIFAAWHGEKLQPLPIKVYYPPREERVTHFRPVADFARIFLLNTVLLFVSLLYGHPLRAVLRLRPETASCRHKSAGTGQGQ